LTTAALAYLAPKIILPLFFKFDPLPEGPVKARLLALCERAGVPAVDASVWRLSAKSRRSNAAVVGWGNTRRVIVADTLLDTYSPEEIEAVLAHELGHHVSGDIRNGILFQLPLMFAGFLALHAVSGWLLAPLDLDTRADLAGMPLLALIFLGASLAALPLASTFSRWREGAADAFALRITGDPEAFIGAMEKLAGQNLADRRPHRLVEALMHSHPAIDRRIARARAWAARQPAAATVSGEGDAS
ncbi:MAG: M48 family metalloprotease, partial [Dehalococcoidia bacterium]